MAPFYSKLIQVSKAHCSPSQYAAEKSVHCPTRLIYYIHLALSCEVQFKTLRPKGTFDCQNYFTLKG